jgi:hypothetical protein
MYFMTDVAEDITRLQHAVRSFLSVVQNRQQQKEQNDEGQ